LAFRKHYELGGPNTARRAVYNDSIAINRLFASIIVAFKTEKVKN
jgi:hypothetical protein